MPLETSGAGGSKIVMSAELWIALAGLTIHGLGVIIAGTWQLSKVRSDVMQSIADQRADFHKLVDDKLTAVYRDIETDRRLVADAIQSVRQATAALEIKSLESFVRRDSFHKFLDTITEARQAFESDIKERLSELQRKMDRLVERGEARKQP